MQGQIRRILCLINECKTGKIGTTHFAAMAMLHQLGLNTTHARFRGLAGGLCLCFAEVSVARYASSGRIASNIAQDLRGTV